MAFDINLAGRYRANPNASIRNSLRLVHPTAPGTPAVDSSTASVAVRQYTGITYNGAFYQFATQEAVSNALVPKVVNVATGQLALGAELLRQAISEVVQRFEVDPVVTVTVTTTNFTFEHVGSGTLSAVNYDGGSYALTRAAITGLDIVEAGVMAAGKVAKASKAKAAKAAQEQGNGAEA